jgi:uncharacterized iron-regulated membrane protein
MSVRRLLVRLHRWSGLTALPILFVVACSGAFLSLAPWLLAVSVPAVPDPRARALPESELLARTARFLSPGEHIATIEWTAPGRAQVLTLSSGDRLFVDPTSGIMLTRQRGDTSLESVMKVVHDLHVRLVAGLVGRWIVDLASVAALFMVASGLALWWRTKRLGIRADSRGRRWYRDLHDMIGIYSSVVIVALALSGILLAWEEPLYWIAGAPPVREPLLPHSHEPAAGDTGVGPNEWIRAARASLPGQVPSKLTLPVRDRSPVSVEFRRPGRPGRSVVWLDRWNAHVLRVDDFRKAARAYRAHIFDRALHTGDLMGTPTAVIVLLGCMALAALAATGFTTWWIR